MSRPRPVRPAAPPNATDSVSTEDPAERTFTIGQVLTVARGYLKAHQLFCSWGEFLAIVGYLLSDIPLLEDMAQAVGEKARPAVLEQHPELADVETPDPLAPNTEVLAWLVEQEKRFGARLMLRPIEVRGP